MANERVIGLITARIGSTRMREKPLAFLGNRRLVTWVLEAAMKSKRLDVVYVSTDSDRIEKTVLEFASQSKMKKPVRVIEQTACRLANPACKDLALIEFSRKVWDEEIVVLLQPTSPLTRAEHIDAAIEMFFKTRCDCLVSVVPFDRFLWRKTPKGWRSNYPLKRRPLMQDIAGQTFVENGAIYIYRRNDLLKSASRLNGRIALFSMPLETIFEVDTEDDIRIIENLVWC